MTNANLQRLIEKNQWLEAIWVLAKQDFPYLADNWRETLSKWAELARCDWQSGQRIEWRLDRLNRLFFSGLGLRSLSAKDDASSIYIHTVLNQGLGNCLGLSTLYLAIADFLEIPLVPVLVNEHVFIRYDDGELRRNIETTHRGSDWVDCMYAGDNSSSNGGSGDLRVLPSRRELLALVLVARCTYIHAPARHWKSAKNDLELAIQLFPDCAHAYMNRSVVQKNLGDEEQAAWDIETALAISHKCGRCGLSTEFLSKRLMEIDFTR